ncbi:unnamed protein product [Clavelina lepadiformis]|uniref:Uncharacterized protein n=1 Tax=Clavelina lepadiformis TaxID=159417 RepID=A0ABP0GAS8_CLALP
MQQPYLASYTTSRSEQYDPVSTIFFDIPGNVASNMIFIVVDVTMEQNLERNNIDTLESDEFIPFLAVIRGIVVMATPRNVKHLDGQYFVGAETTVLST